MCACVYDCPPLLQFQNCKKYGPQPIISREPPAREKMFMKGGRG